MIFSTKKSYLEKIKEIGIRVVILYLFSVLFKMFDYSYPDKIFFVHLRGVWFSIFFISYGLIVWELSGFIGAKINSILQKQTVTNKLIILGIGQFCFGLIISIVFSYIYSSLDIFLFGKGMWTEGPVLLDFNLNMAAFIFYLLILSYSAVVFYHRHWREEQLYAERLKRENLQARYDTLRNQLDAHFLFNSLSVLTNLVYKDPDLSAEYITRLSRMFRYVLEAKEKSVVHVSEELDFLKAYLFLMDIRFPESIRWELVLSDAVLEYYIPPATLQLLVENAIKHNKFTPQSPLKIFISEADGMIVVENNLDERPQLESSLGLGLDNIRKRLELVSGKAIIVEKTSDKFLVKIPLMTELHYEHFNI